MKMFITNKKKKKNSKITPQIPTYTQCTNKYWDKETYLVIPNWRCRLRVRVESVSKRESTEREREREGDWEWEWERDWEGDWERVGELEWDDSEIKKMRVNWLRDWESEREIEKVSDERVSWVGSKCG